ncbi:MAG: hypothetical protein U0930_04395 [Pirellulales bacterium]
MKTVSIGLAGAVSKNELNTVTESFINRCYLGCAGSVQVDANRNGQLIAVAVAAAGSLPTAAKTVPAVGVSVDAAASIAINEITGSTQSRIKDAEIHSQSTVLVHAIDNSKILADGGGLSIAVNNNATNAPQVWRPSSWRQHDSQYRYRRY